MSIISLNEMAPMWSPGNDPTTHPLWAEQVQHERDMMLSGADKVRERLVTATERDRLNSLKPVQKLIIDWLPRTVEVLKADIRGWKTARGVRPLALQYLDGKDYFAYAHVALKTILNHIGRGSASLQTTAMEIGKTIEHEERIRLWEKEAPNLYQATQKALTRDKATASHRRLVNIHEFNKLSKAKAFGDGEGWVRWNRDVHFRVGWALLDAITRATGMFTKAVDPSAYEDTRQGYHTPLVLTFKPELLAWWQEAMRHAEANSPIFKPTIIPPKRWEGMRSGGYYTPYVKAPALVRFSASSDAQQFKAHDEYDSLDMGATNTALNLLQETAYRVNSRVLEVANAAWYGLQLHSKTLPKQKEEALPPRTARMAKYDELVAKAKKAKKPVPMPDKKTEREIAEWKHQASHVYAENAQIVGRGRATHTTLEAANDLNHLDAMYYPHKLDFRGRIYPIPGFLQPQGDDLARGLLSYASAVPVSAGNGGDEALAIHTANQFGHDKISNRDRIEWVKQNRNLFENIAENPIEARSLWMNKDTENFQALAAAMEWADYLKQGDGFMSSLPCMVDGTCNGIQHLSALTRDEVTGALVNLTPSDKPQDVYKFAAVAVQEVVLEDLSDKRRLNHKLAKWWMDVVGGDLPRSMTKRQVMVLPYGGTLDSYFGYTREWLFAERYDLIKDVPKDQLREAVVYMAKLMWSVVNARLPAPLKVMNWLKDMASVAAEEDQPIYWQVPTGFMVRHFYGKQQGKVVDSLLSGERVRLTINEYTPELSKQDQLKGIPPNFTHSIDASCLVRTCETLSDVGISSFTSVHDAYGTHAGNMRHVTKHLRDAFVWVHEHDLLGIFRQSCIDVIAPTLILKGIDPMEAEAKASDMLDRKAGRLDYGNLDLESVKNSDYFFA